MTGDDLRPGRRVLLRAGLLGPAGLALAGCSGGSSPVATPSSAPSATSGPASTSPSTSALASPSAGPPPGPVRPRLAGTVATGLAVPWNARFLPSGDALVTLRDTGEIVRVGAAGRVRRVGAVAGVVSNASAGGEGGLLGLALAPDFASSRLVYAYHTAADGNRVVRMTYDGSLGPARTVLAGIDSSVHHNGGGLVFGPDGHLFVSTGDAEDTAHAQDTGSLNGKVLRLRADGSVPAGNPFGNAVWSSGHRNVEGLAFDAAGRLWASEFGDRRADELNRIVRGGDYGWPDAEGASDDPAYRDPVATWRPDDCSPSGIAVARGRAWLAALQGECLFSVELSGAAAGRVRRHDLGAHGRLRAVTLAPDGSLWVGTSNRDGRATPSTGDDRLLRVTLD